MPANYSILTNIHARNCYLYFVDQVNKQFGTHFILTTDHSENSEFESDGLVFHSPCIFDIENCGPNPVKCYLQKNGCFSITCYHEKCQKHFKYRNIEQLLNSHSDAYLDSYSLMNYDKIVTRIEDLDL